jgi:hypothetical protein
MSKTLRSSSKKAAREGVAVSSRGRRNSQARVLIFAYHPRSLWERQLFLMRNGYEVVVTSEFVPARKLINTKGKSFDFLVTGHAVPEDERHELAKAFRHVQPSGLVVFLYEDAIKNHGSAAAILLSVNGPKDNLLSAIHTAQQKGWIKRNGD